MSQEPCRSGRISRRDFARAAALAAAGAASAACLPTELSSTPLVAPPLPPHQADEKLSPESQAEVEAKIQAILGKYGSRFSDEQKAEIRRLVTEGQKPLEAMREFSLDNSDQPSTVLKLYPDPAAPRRAPQR